MNYKKGIFLLGLGLSMLAGRNANAQLSASGNVINNVSCNGGNNGSASAILSGGTSPFTYSWAPSGGNADTASGLASGTYTVTVEDINSNTATASVTINQPDAVSVSASVVANVSCNGASNGTAVASISGGTSPFTYSWSNSGTMDTASGLSAGTYTVTVTDSCGGTASASATISQPVFLVSANITDNVTCNGGSTGAASSSINGGTSPFTYSWAPAGGSNSSASGLSAGTYTVTVTDSCGGTASAMADITQPAVLSATTSVANVSCNGGTDGQASAVLTGGTGPYTYSWTGGATTDTATGLSAGGYTVTVQDACGGSATAQATITEPAVLGIAPFVVANISCNGGSTGSASAGLTGGGSPFTYSWTGGASNDTATGLTAGSYTVTVTDACGGTATGSVTLTQPNAISISASVTANITCYGTNTGSASTSVSGGTLPYVYSWSNGGTMDTASNLVAGGYTVTVTDSCGGTATAAITITQPNALAITASVTANVTCHGGSTGSVSSVASNGTSPYTYSWAPSGGTNSSASNLTAGTYTVTVTDMCGASATAKATITQPAVLSVSASPSSNVTCNGGDNGDALANVSGGTLPYTYTWNNGETVASATGLSAGTYTVTVEDFCGATLSAITVISQPNPLSVTAAVASNVSCHGGNTGKASSTPLGGTSPYTYTWSNGATVANATGLTAGSYSLSVQDNCGATVTATVALTEPSMLAVVATTLTNNSCNGGNAGSVSAAISGGTSSYIYSWAPSGGNNAVANGLLAGVYTVTVTDSCGATATASTTVTQPVALAVTAHVLTGVSCNGGDNGSASSAASGGTGPYAYSWAPAGGNSPSAINLTAGIYTVSVTDACGGVASTTVTINQPTPLAISASVTSNNTCYGQFNGAATSQLSGGTKPYIYNWLPTGGHGSSISNVAAGTYTVTVYDSCGASATATTTITQPAQLKISATTLTNIACYGQNTGSATTSAIGGISPYEYFWSNGSSNTTVSGLPAGNYTVEVTDQNGCTSSTISVVTQPNAITVTAHLRNDNGNGSGAIWLDVNGGVSPYAYLWTPGGSIADSLTGIGAGNYCCTITDNNGCIDNICETISSDLGVDNVSSSTGTIKVYPNPSTGMFTIQSSVVGGQMAIEVYNLLGEVVYSQSDIHNAQFTINLSNQPNGIYLYRIISNDNGNLLGEGKVVLQK